MKNSGQVIERTVDKKGQHLLTPEVEVEGGWTSLADAPEAVIAPYRYHGTHEPFHSEIKTDLDLERLPSGKFGTNDAMLHLVSTAPKSGVDLLTEFRGRRFC